MIILHIIYYYRVSNIVNVHLNSNQELLDGFDISEHGHIELEKILDLINSVTQTEVKVVTEVKEKQIRDYLNAPNQKEMGEWLNDDYYPVIFK